MKRYGNGIIVSKGGGGNTPWEDGGARFYYTDAGLFDSMANVGVDGDTLFAGSFSPPHSTPDGVDYLIIAREQQFSSYYDLQSSLNGNAIMICVTDTLPPSGSPGPVYIGRGAYLWPSGYIAIDPDKTGRFTKFKRFDKIYIKRNGVWQPV